MTRPTYINGWIEKESIYLLREDGFEDQFPADKIAYFRKSEIPDFLLSAMLKDKRIDEIDPEGSYYRVKYLPGRYDRTKINPKSGQYGTWIDFREEHCREFQRAGIEPLEADVSPLKRYMIDSEVEIGRPVVAFWDIETDSRQSFESAKNGNARILVVGIVGENGKTWTGCLTEDTDDAERDLLASSIDVFERYQMLVGWNSDGFDTPVFRARCAKLGVHFDHRRWLFLDHMLLFKKQNLMSSESGEEKQSFKLQNIATALLGDGKDDVDGSKTWQYWVAGGDERTRLADYCLKDTDLLRRIEEKTGYIETFFVLCQTTFVFPHTGTIKPTQGMDAVMLRLAKERDIHFRTKWFDEEVVKEKYEGAYVKKPEATGIIKNCHVCDFASLYPTIMVTWNICPTTKVRIQDPRAPLANNECISPQTGYVSRTDIQGILPIAVDNFMKLRAKWNKIRASLPPGTPEAKDAERRTNSYKVAANSLYGLCGNEYGRYYDKTMAESISTNGAFLIKLTITEAEKLGYHVAYSDTDSCFIAGCSAEEFQALVDHCNQVVYPAALKSLGCTENRISLAFEKTFSRLVFVAAKRYVGKFATYKGTAAKADSKPEIKGLEVKRGDTNRLARRMQTEVIEMFARGEESVDAYYELCQNWKRRILEQPLELEDIVLSKGISRELKDYVARAKKDGSTGSVPAHVRLAKDAKDAGEEVGVGTRIRYVVVDALTSPATVIPADQYNGECDRAFMWQNMVWPASYRLLKAMFPKSDFEHFDKARATRHWLPGQMDLFGAGGRVAV